MTEILPVHKRFPYTSPIWYACHFIGMLPKLQFDESVDLPIYRQIFDQLRDAVLNGSLEAGERLPATRTLADQLGLNRQTISSAYELLEQEGFIRGQVGRGSFVTLPGNVPARRLDWDALFQNEANLTVPPTAAEGVISFTASRPSELLFPLNDFRETCQQVISDSPTASAILQLGTPAGYKPLRRYLLAKAAEEGIARPTDDIIVTNGVQQALDLLQRVVCAGASNGPVVVEDPVFPGLKNIFAMSGTRLIGVPAGNDGIDVEALGRVLLRERPRLLILTPNFQNPTGSTLPLDARRAVIRMARESQTVLVENDIYGALRYRGEALPTLKQLDEAGDVVLLRSFSKLAFPGLRVGWVIAPKQLTARLTDAKQVSDLHTDQLSQAVLLRFAESGRLNEHRHRILVTGRERLEAALDACANFLPEGAQFTRPDGGMNLWIRLPEQLDSGELLGPAQRAGVAYLPGKYFAVSRDQSSCLRISFAGLDPARIRTGLEKLGTLFRNEAGRARAARAFETETAFV